MNLARLFEPRGIAVVGASATPGKLGHEAMANAAASGPPAYPVNPNGPATLFDRPVGDAVTDVDGEVDLALVCVPPPVVPEVLADCGDAGIGAAVVYAGGFAEAGADGQRLQADLAAVADDHGIAVLGPNTSGFLLPGSELYASFVGGVRSVEPGSVAVVAQSGGVAHAAAFQARREGRGVSAMVGLGNRAGVDFADAVRYFDGHDPTDAVALHVEGTDDARGLLEACRAADLPVVAYNVGREDVDDFAASHTGALTGDRALYEAGCRQYGVPTVESTTELLDAAAALAAFPEPAGPNVGLVTAQAGPGIAIADRLRAAGARFPDLGDDTRRRLDDLLPGVTYAENPVDTGRPSAEFGDAVAAVADDDAVDVVLAYVLHEAAIGLPVDALATLAEEGDNPVLLATDGPERVDDDATALREAGVPVVATPERGADAAAALVEYATLHSGGTASGEAGSGPDTPGGGVDR